MARIDSEPPLTCTWAPGPGTDATLKIQAEAAAFREATQAQVIVHLEAPAGDAISIPVSLRRDD